MKARIIMIIMGVALMALPTMAQQQEWKSTSSMAGTGSAYSTQVSTVGATAVPSMATTTESYSPNRAKRSTDNPGEPAIEFQDEGSPIGDAVVPLMLCAAVFCGVIAIRRKRSALNG